ncbi:MAG: ribosome biogenesis GTPase Der [Bacillota bacterium]
MPKPIVAIVGRPNVGKSTLFNRIVGGRTAIVEDIPGVTRDRLYRDTSWQDRDFTLVDTGGIQEGTTIDPITIQVKNQAQLAIEEADVILFVVDARDGITADDQAVADILRTRKIPVLLVANKVEDYRDQSPVYEFYSLGLGDPIPISAEHGMNTGDLLDTLVEALPKVKEEEYPEDMVKIALIGRPNVGKSSLVNCFLGEQRVIVSNIPGTTRDAIDSVFRYNDREYVLIDTAGMRRKARIEISTERYSVMRALRAVDRSDVSLVILDAVEGVTEQDKKIAGYAHEAGKAIILVINKWDLVEKDTHTMKRFDEDIRDEMAFLGYAPTMYVSALTHQRVFKLLEQVDLVVEQASQRVPTSGLNDLISEMVHLNPPPGDKGKQLKFFYVTQTGVKPPTFVFFVNDPLMVHFSYKRYLENKLREAYGFQGNPLRLLFRRRAGMEQR